VNAKIFTSKTKLVEILKKSQYFAEKKEFHEWHSISWKKQLRNSVLHWYFSSNQKNVSKKAQMSKQHCLQATHT